MLYIKVIDLQYSLARVQRTAEIGNTNAESNNLLYRMGNVNVTHS